MLHALKKKSGVSSLSRWCAVNHDYDGVDGDDDVNKDGAAVDDDNCKVAVAVPFLCRNRWGLARGVNRSWCATQPMSLSFVYVHIDNGATNPSV